MNTIYYHCQHLNFITFSTILKEAVFFVDNVTSIWSYLLKSGALTWGEETGGGKGIRRFRRVSDVEWHSELLHSSQPVQSKQTAVTTGSSKKKERKKYSENWL